MEIKFFAFFRDITHETSRQWERPAGTAGALLHQLSEHYGQDFRKKVFNPDGSLGSNLIILVNGQNIRDLQGADTPLGPTDAVCVFPLVAGG